MLFGTLVFGDDFFVPKFKFMVNVAYILPIPCVFSGLTEGNSLQKFQNIEYSSLVWRVCGVYGP